MVAQTEPARLRTLYRETIAPSVMKQFDLRNANQVPWLSKIIVNCGIGR